MGRKARSAGAVLVVLVVVCALPAMSYWGWIRADLSRIEAPKNGQALDYHPVEIVVSLKRGALSDTFEAWLNGHDITDLFEPVPGGLHAYVTPEEGLNRRIIGQDTGLAKHNLLFTTIQGTGGKWDIDFQSFSVQYKPVRTVRDDKGVFFISGGSLFDVSEAMGYAVACDRLWQMEKYRRSARGRLSEVFGISQRSTDIFMRTIGYSDEELFDGFDALDRETQIMLEGYVEGVNRRIDEIRTVPTLLPFEFVMAGFTPDYWAVEDVLAWQALLLRQFDCEALNTTQIENAALIQDLMSRFGADAGYAMFNDLRWINDPDALTYIPGDTVAAATMARRSAAGAVDAGDHPGLPVDLKAASDEVPALFEEVKENLRAIDAFVKMGSYAWVVSGSRTEDRRPIIYSGPQMGFSVPSIVLEASIRGGGMDISGMSVPGLPGIIIGRTPHHAWSMQVGHAHTTDYYLEAPESVYLHRVETIHVLGQPDYTLPVYRSARGPVINQTPLISWKYAHWGYEFANIASFLKLARARSMDEFGQAIEGVAVSQHFCYADRDGNIAYWMSGRDPIRPAGEWRLPQGAWSAPLEWDAANLRARSTDRNTSQGYYCGWNNKSSPDYNDPPNNQGYHFGPFHRAHVIDDYLSAHDDLTYEEVRDLALYIATTDSYGGGGIPWDFAADDFVQAVQAAGPDPEREEAVALLEAWDGHFVDGGPSQWALGSDRADAWILMDAWTREAIRLTFADELGPNLGNINRLFNVLLHGLDGATMYPYWFMNMADPAAPQDPQGIIVTSLDNVLAALGERPWGTGKRGGIPFNHEMLGTLWQMPFSSRSTYAHCVEFDHRGPARIESMFPLGESGTILFDGSGPVFDVNFFSMTPVFDPFTPRTFPLFR